MRVIIAGGRTIWNYDALDFFIAKTGWNITQVVCGMAPGMDSVGWAWAHVNGIPIAEYPADWETHGRKAGVLRNLQMAENADALVLIWDGVSKGSAHMRFAAHQRGLQVAECIADAD